MKLKAIILRNEEDQDHLLWVKACKDNCDSIEYRIVNLIENNWLEEIQKCTFDILLAKPGGFTAPLKQVYDERVYILVNVLHYNIFPSIEEIYIYENKRFLSYWLKANDIPHPETIVSYNREEAYNYAETILYPIVAKTNIGASGSGVRVLYNIEDAHKYIKSSFSTGSPKRIGPNLVRGNLFRRGLFYFRHPSEISRKLKKYYVLSTDKQVGFIIFQEYIEHDFEWRVVRIGNSYFAHKKIKVGDKASGALKKDYVKPPFALLDMVKVITDQHQFYSLAIDIFESEKGFLVNEMQCIFGQSDDYQMLVNNIPGRYIFKNEEWIFEEGSFNKNESYNLRVKWVIERYS